MKRTTITDGISWLLVLLLLYTGVMKLSDIGNFHKELSTWPLIEPAAGFLAWTLPTVGILLAGLVVFPQTRLKGLYGIAGFIGSFVAYDGIILGLDYHIVSTSGGLLDGLSPREYILFNGACLILSLLALRSATGHRKKSVHGWAHGTFAVAAIAVIAWLMFSSFTSPIIHRSGFEGRPLPSINLLLPDSITRFNTDNLSTGQPIIVIGFAPFCKYCQAQTRDILEHAYLFKDTRILYVTPEPYKGMKMFYRHYGLQKYPNITVGRDSANIYFNYFKANGTPFIAIYDARKRLRKIIGGQDSAFRLAQIALQ